jgi:hypothetical protein
MHENKETHQLTHVEESGSTDAHISVTKAGLSGEAGTDEYANPRSINPRASRPVDMAV